ncbi:pyrimidine 5'-nucleotidase [Pacificimonas sp. WHA3]|uniref:Pyrimidine 5'-nucleotidase n=1 Tax=Pacificimonas pallii TaxID=2827236 RepID=A0ABS6SCT9_9SPHN|nr:pyrimidine 5'-nucleotidase [Pacificimonas pallii]MBV7255731.1 pyrimidine 5'-nucleotidase [Pacificimonas pallii]
MIDLSRIDTWLFDMDNTLYPASVNLFSHIDERMGAFIAEELGVDRGEARRIQKAFFHEHGTTLRGLMDEHDVTPQRFLDYVHDIDMSALTEDARVTAGIAALPGRKFVFTNGDVAYADKVLSRLGLGAHFEAVHDIHAMDYRPKPEPGAYRGMCKRHDIDPERSLFVEDMARNLAPAKALGMRTVWIDNGSESAAYCADMNCVDLVIDDLGDWLARVTKDMT